MPFPTVYSYADSADVAKAVATTVIKQQNEAIKAHGDFSIALSGGSLVSVLRKGLLDHPEINWAKWTIFFADERIVPLDHEDSNYGLTKRELLDYLPVQPRVFTISAELIAAGATSEKVASHYAEVLDNNLNTVSVFVDKTNTTSRTVPKFDLVLLGCGPDGHTCSLFPGHALLNEKKLTVAAIEDSPKPPPRRITLTKPVLQGASQIAFVAEGAGKAEILKRIFDDHDVTLPSAQVNVLAHKSVLWFVNDAAIEGVNVSRHQL
ncbi:hypothetical protein D0Z03_000084 [Geotrichum reessii]|nr:hypothetical protein D0Z03_000084 [Galactomyces reessii]